MHFIQKNREMLNGSVKYLELRLKQTRMVSNV